MMRFGEVSVKASRDFDGERHLKRHNAVFAHNMDGVEFLRIFFLTGSGDISAIGALHNLTRVVLARPEYQRGSICPMVKDKVLGHINSVLKAWEWGTTFGHSFHIGGASYYLAQKENSEIQVASRHMGAATDFPNQQTVAQL
ncbi:hypothetical protein J3R30DRAFT_3522412 [Lentinula aciculospora]|uniref:Uncharacterized protein n=1 Tax=Lentinula aciculospora TaxID=153920 RepID=A0A9W9A169_9AGAR|nr:hypothetical protein J3R30DRAFT_3522412 [Lentinula aciculospora]